MLCLSSICFLVVYSVIGVRCINSEGEGITAGVLAGGAILLWFIGVKGMIVGLLNYSSCGDLTRGSCRR